MRVKSNIKPAYIITTPRMGMRRWTTADLAPFSAMNLDPEVMKYFPATLTIPESKEALHRIMAHFENFDYGLFVVETLADGKFVGFTGFNRPAFTSFFTPCVEIGWRLVRGAWGQGLATEAAKACLEYGFNTFKFEKVYSFTATANFPSERVMQKIGMAKVGEFDHPKIAPDHPLCRHVLYERTLTD